MRYVEKRNLQEREMFIDVLINKEMFWQLFSQSAKFSVKKHATAIKPFII